MSLAVSVLIPTYNRMGYLVETLESVLSQTYPPAEVIVVDDGSTDDTRGAVGRFGDRVRYRFVENGGVCRARNIAASMASSSFLAFCDSDDLWRKDKLAQQMGLHESHPELRCSFTNFALVADGAWSKATKFDSAPAGFFESVADGVFLESLYNSILRFQPIFPSTLVVSQDLFREIGGYKEELGRTLSEDLEFILRCVQQGPTGVVQEPVVGIRKHESNFSGDTYLTVRGELIILKYVLEHHAIDAATRALVMEQIYLRSVDASTSAFRRGEFNEVLALTSGVPASYLDSKAKLKRWIAMLPAPIARRAQGLLLKG